MRDLHILTSRKYQILDITDALRIVRGSYPTATQEGSMGSYHWIANGIIVGEAWLHNRKGKGWWLRVKEI